jgi:hypothetical protein
MGADSAVKSDSCFQQLTPPSPQGGDWGGMGVLGWGDPGGGEDVFYFPHSHKLSPA